ncbi:MAG TPA: N-6 DNA methylase [Terriglobales bacterium]|nr:N-6 DNA methylase [Terriglobales bacterium]
MSVGLSLQWKEALALSRRQAPEFYEPGVDIAPGPHADAIRFALSDLGLTGVFCIEGVPTIGFLREDEPAPERLDRVHRILWNQGLMSLLLVVRDDELLAYSLVHRPIARNPNQKGDPRLIETMRLVDDALKLRELIDSAESGRFWLEHDSHFDPAQRVDTVLLNNLIAAFAALKDDLGPDGAQALLMQSMFIAYLEDRKIVRTERFQEVSNKACASFEEILNSRSTSPFEALFAWLKKAFNVDVFLATCAFELGKTKPPKVKAVHLKVLADFRHGKVEMTTGQLRFLGYDFEFMPITLISAVYDRFLNEEREQKNADGAYYTPMFLADFAVNQIWDELTDAQRKKGVLFDPACGSGIFLVRLFQRLVAAHCLAAGKRFATWKELSAIVQRLHGADINAAAVRVAAFSLYIALLEYSNPRDLDVLIEKGKLLPTLFGHTLRCEDFFGTPDDRRYDAVVGNPPWKGRAGQKTTAQAWADAQRLPHPAKDIAWCFVWKSLRVVRTDGLVALLLPAMGTLHNVGSSRALELFFQKARVHRIVNLSDLCFQLFDRASRPTVLALYHPQTDEGQPYRFEYWVPKADLNLRLKRTMTLSRADRVHLRSDQVQNDPAVFKRKLWARSPDERLLQFIKTMPPLSLFIVQGDDNGRGASRTKSWAIGQGFQPAHETTKGSTTTSAAVRRFPYFAAKDFRPIALPRVDSKPWRTSKVRRAGFTAGFTGPHILIPQGLERSSPRLRAAYTEQSLCFEHSLQAIVFPDAERKTAKLLTAVLNSSLAAWFYLHETANIGTDRAKILQNELLKLPFAKPEAMPDPTRAAQAAEQIVALMDREIENATRLLQTQSNILDELDPLVCDYYGLDSTEMALIQDTTKYILPAIQPRRKAGLQAIWDASRPEQRSAYATTLCEALKPWFNTGLSASLAARSNDIGVLKLTLGTTQGSSAYAENSAAELETFLNNIANHLPTRLPGNVQLVPDLRFVIGLDLYLVKPMQVRHWLRATALADAEQIAAELNAAMARQSNKDAQDARG